MRPVELGINNDDYVEVLSGLQEGEQVVLPTLASSSGQNNTQIRGVGGMGFGAVPAGEIVRTSETRIYKN
jgi:HlyD family secretion protein